MAIVCIVFVVFPISLLCAYALCTLPLALLLSLLRPCPIWIGAALHYLGLLAGIVAGIWVCRFAWPPPLGSPTGRKAGGGPDATDPGARG